MRKRFVLLALVLAVVVALLSAAAYAQFSNHIILRGALTNGHMLTITPPIRPAGVPANASVTKITLHGTSVKSSTKQGLSGPDAPIAGGGWTCEIWQYAWKEGSHTMAGNSAYSCDGADLIDFDQWADYCKPVLWGCTWQNATRTFPGCTYVDPVWGACPSSGYYNRVYNIPTGQLWRERSYICAWGPPGTTADCGFVIQQVQL